jgi:hypothetical protein
MEPSATEPKKILSFADIKARESAAGAELAHIPAWGGDVRIRPLKVRELEQIERLATDPATGERDERRQKVLILMETLVEPKLEFGQAQELCSDFRAVPVQQVWNAVNRINGLGGEAIAEADKSAGD